MSALKADLSFLLADIEIQSFCAFAVIDPIQCILRFHNQIGLLQLKLLNWREIAYFVWILKKQPIG